MRSAGPQRLQPPTRQSRDGDGASQQPPCKGPVDRKLAVKSNNAPVNLGEWKIAMVDHSFGTKKKKKSGISF